MTHVLAQSGRPDSARSKRRRGDDGAALVEFAIVMPLLFMLLLGIFTGGFAYNQKLAVVNGVREGSRYGATLPVASAPACAGGQLDCWLQQVATITMQGSEGELNSGVAELVICVAYHYPSGSEAADRTRSLTVTGVQSPSTGTFSNSRCFDDGRPNNERRVQVSGSRQGKLEFLLFSMTPTLRSSSVTKFEAVAP